MRGRKSSESVVCTAKKEALHSQSLTRYNTGHNFTFVAGLGTKQVKKTVNVTTMTTMTVITLRQ